MADVSRMNEALELISERAKDDPELAGALRTVLENVLVSLPAPALEPVQDPSPVPEPVWKEPEPLEEPAEYEPTYAEWPDLSAVAENLALKAQASRWVARHGYTEERKALNTRFELLNEARAIDLYLWMFDRNRVDLEASDDLAELAELFELTTQALVFWQDAADTPEEKDADYLLADTQAALRVAIQGLSRISDGDQYALFKALRLSGQASRTYLPQLSMRYNPLSTHDLKVQLQALTEAKERREANERTLKKLLSKARYLVGLVQETPTDVTQWRKADEVLGELDVLGEDVTDLLEPLRGLTVPDELPDLAVRLALPELVPEQTVSPRVEDAPSAEVTRVRELLAGREVVIVGGEVRREAVEGFERAFGCRVRWIESAPHISLSVFEPAITEEVAAVLLLIRWASHSYGELVRVCKDRGVPLVRLAAGYNPNRVAHDILEQAEERLERSHTHLFM